MYARTWRLRRQNLRLRGEHFVPSGVQLILRREFPGEMEKYSVMP
jgi:hypothetical protein